MELMLWLIPASIGFTAMAVGAFVWAVRTSQFEALDRHALDILDDPADRSPGERTNPEHTSRANPEHTSRERTTRERTTSGENR